MFGKTPVTALEEYCAKTSASQFSNEKPVYQFLNSETDKSFLCRVSVFDEIDDGVGRSKKEAKHDAAANMIKRLKISHPDIQDIPQAPHETISISDAVAGLRDLCIQLDHPLPTFDIIQKTGPPEAPEFTAECKVASLKRYGVACTKKGAKQKAAQQIIEIIRMFNINGNEKNIARLDDIMKETEETDHNRIKTYREYIEADLKIKPGTLLSERHNYFSNLDENVKIEALKILDDDESFLSDYDKVHQCLKKLKIKYKTGKLETMGQSAFTFVELVCCDIDCIFANTEDKIWNHMINYLKEMLV